MSRRRRGDSTAETRTAAVGRKGRSVPSESSSKRSDKRQRLKKKKNNKNKASVGDTSTQRNFIPFSTLQESEFAQAQDQAMANPNYGSNRLQSGFQRRNEHQEKDISNTRGSCDSNEEGEVIEDSDDHPIVYEIDSTDDDDAGGITLNIDRSGHEPITISDDEDGHKPVHSLSAPTSHGELTDTAGKFRIDEPSFLIDPAPSTRHLHLRDLNPGQFEDQIRYAFWYLKRDQIDLSRSVRCLQCQAEGHIDEQCPERSCRNCGASKHSPSLCPQMQRCDVCRQPGHLHCAGMKNTTIPCDVCACTGHTESSCSLRHSHPVHKPRLEKLELWISCSYCASKSHLVGDCTSFGHRSDGRWSLKVFENEKDQIVNLSIQKGVDKLEKAAQNKGMRPEGMKIKGNASRHNADSGRRDSDNGSDDQQHFLSHPPIRRNDRHKNQDVYRPTESSRYDRYAAPSNSDDYRPPRNAFYATDSFGRGRSRSPPRQSFAGRRRSYTPSGSEYETDQHLDSRRTSPKYSLRSRADGHTGSGPHFSMQLPTRKGSNPNLNNTQSGGNKTRKQRHYGKGA